MNAEMGQAWFRVAFFMTTVSGILLFVESPGTAEFVITVTSFVMGLVFILIIALIVRRMNH